MPLSLLQCLLRMPHLGSDVESIFTSAKAVEHVAAGCIAHMDPHAFLPIPEIDFNRITQRGLPVRAQCVGNVSKLQPEAIISRSDTDRRDRGGRRITSAGREMSRPRLDIVQTTLGRSGVPPLAAAAARSW